MQITRIAAIFVVAVLWPVFTAAEQLPESGGRDGEIRIGNLMPYTGPLAAFGSIGRAEAAYFDMVNDNGGINGRKLRLISYDDSSNPVSAAERVRKLVEVDK